MKYLLLMYANEAQSAAITQEEGQTIYQDWMDFMKQANEAGVLLANNGVAPSHSATTVRVRDGQTLTVDGPFAETHEQLAGYSVVECPNLDEAIRWATKVPMARYGSVEVRPLWSPQA